jgi:TnpA family transposase
MAMKFSGLTEERISSTSASGRLARTVRPPSIREDRAFDGSLHELAERNLLADFHFRYRLKGAVAFHVVSDLYFALSTHYAHLESLFCDPIAWRLIATHRPDLMQVALPMTTGRITSATLLLKLWHYSRRNRLFLAAQEIGRVIRTRYLLQWISGPALRSEVTAGTNEVETYHALTEWLRFGLEGAIQENAPEEQ